MAFDGSGKRDDAYQLGSAALFLSAAAILAALAFEHLGGYRPCPLCLMQRYAYYAAMPTLFVALILSSGGRKGLAALLFAAVALGFLANVGLGVYHAGAEWKFWPGPDSCAGDQALSATAGGLLKDLETIKVVRCDEASWRMFGLSVAGWSAVVSSLAGALAARAAQIAAQTRRRSL
ncbi:MAG: disulfide bond formation protein B [Hyphomicrobium sp.]